jgi:hypothetical protein
MLVYVFDEEWEWRVMSIANVGLMQTISGAMTEQALHKCSSLALPPGTITMPNTMHMLE